jgi:hypothetical protein
MRRQRIARFSSPSFGTEALAARLLRIVLEHAFAASGSAFGTGILQVALDFGFGTGLSITR